MENYIYKLLQRTKFLEQKWCWDGIPKAINFIAVLQCGFFTFLLSSVSQHLIQVHYSHCCWSTSTALAADTLLIITQRTWEQCFCKKNWRKAKEHLEIIPEKTMRLKRKVFNIQSLTWKNSKHSEVETDEFSRNSPLHIQKGVFLGGRWARTSGSLNSLYKPSVRRTVNFRLVLQLLFH